MADVPSLNSEDRQLVEAILRVQREYYYQRDAGRETDRQNKVKRLIENVVK